MEDNELMRLRKEVARLTQLLDIVLLRNTQLEQEISAYQQSSSSPETLNTSIHKSVIGGNGIENPNDKSVNGVSKLGSANDDSVNGVKLAMAGDSQINNGGNEPQSALSSSRLAEVPSKAAQVQAKLRKLMPKSSRRSIRNTAAILFALRQNSKQSIKELKLLTGMSEDGMVKRIMSLKKYGLVVRVRGTGLVLTPQAEEILGER